MFSKSTYISITKFEAILQHYYSRSEVQGRVGTGVDEPENSNYASNWTSGELLQRVQRFVIEPDVDQLSVADLVQLEKELNATLMQTRSRKTQLMMESMTTLKDKEKLLREENELLQRQISAVEKDVNRNNITAKEKNAYIEEAVIDLNNLLNDEVDLGPQRATLGFR